MFGSDKRKNNDKIRVTTVINTLIAEGTEIQGDVRFSGGLHLGGAVSGSIYADDANAILTISETGRVDGEIRVSNAVVNGIVNGDMFVGERLELASSARIEGNVHYKVLEIAAGAQINGKMLYQTEPLKRLSPPGSIPVQAVPMSDEKNQAKRHPKPVQAHP
ncbi:MAG: polymer-forming cytoskeletal protein [Rhodanobacter sp.]|nr:polymer-forming cytoskeletal protein [Rhodanobacter sp.]